MTKLREPHTFADAVTRIMGVVSPEACAEALGKSESLIRKFADPDHDSLPSIQQAYLLDAVYVAATGVACPPLLRVYKQNIEGLTAPAAPKAAKPLTEAALTMQQALGSFAGKIVTALDGNSPGGAAVTTAERAEIYEILENIRQQIGAIEASLLMHRQRSA